MIVTCEACETQFQLDDSKVPESGIRVRCSRCKHAFHIESPQMPDIDRAEELARGALQPASSAPAERGPGEDLESDWQFNEDVAQETPATADGLHAAQAAVDDLLGDIGPDSRFPEPDLAAAEDEDPGALANADGIDLGDSVLDAPEPADSFDLGDSALDAPELADSFDREVQELGEDPYGLDAEAAADPVSDDDPFGDTEGFEDLGLDSDDEFAVAEPEPGASALEPPPAPEKTAVARIRPDVPTELDAGDSRQKNRRGREIDFGADEDSGRAWMAWARGGLGWSLVAGMLGYIAFLSLWPTANGEVARGAAHTVGGVAVEEVDGRWVENAAAGPLFVISGWLNSESAQPPRPGMQLRIRLLDSDGAALVAVSSAVGPPLRQEQLREWNLPDLRELHERRALRMAWKPMSAGERWPFQAILAEVPAAAASFEFQSVQTATSNPDESELPASPFEGGNPHSEMTAAPTG